MIPVVSICAEESRWRSELHAVMNERLAARQTAFHDRDDNEDDYSHRRHYDNSSDSLRTQAGKAKMHQGQIR